LVDNVIIMRKSIDIVNNKAEPLADDVLECIHRVMHAYRGQQFQALREGPHAVTHMDSKVLGFFARHGGASLSDLALHSKRDKAQLARLVAGLRERGLLQAKADEHDGRISRLSLTAEGLAAQRALHTQAKRLATRALVDFDGAERGQLAALLRRVLANLEREA
jgi:DNA-binding MarR family transcriptional regulator